MLMGIPQNRETTKNIKNKMKNVRLHWDSLSNNNNCAGEIQFLVFGWTVELELNGRRMEDGSTVAISGEAVCSFLDSNVNRLG